jgi:hypothetical protein
VGRFVSISTFTPTSQPREHEKVFSRGDTGLPHDQLRVLRSVYIIYYIHTYMHTYTYIYIYIHIDIYTYLPAMRGRIGPSQGGDRPAAWPAEGAAIRRPSQTWLHTTAIVRLLCQKTWFSYSIAIRIIFKSIGQRSWFSYSIAIRTIQDQNLASCQKSYIIYTYKIVKDQKPGASLVIQLQATYPCSSGAYRACRSSDSPAYIIR